jgi:uncharacterized membrane protein
MSADAPFIILLVLHVGAIVAWMGGAALFVSVIIPSLSKMSPAARSEFIQSALPRYLRFIMGSSILAIVAGLALYVYITQVATSFAPSSPWGYTFVSLGSVVGLIVLVLALGVLVPAGRKFIVLTKQAPSQDSMATIASLQKRMGITGRLGVSLLGVALILMVIGASI